MTMIKPIPFKASRKISRNLPTEYFVLARPRFEGAIAGYLAGEPICETVVDANGQRYHFAGVAPRDAAGRYDVTALRPGEWVVQPGLIYMAEEGTLQRAGQR